MDKTGDEYFLDIDYSQIFKNKQIVGGDVFYSRKIEDKGSIVTVLSDGLGSGIKASVLATLTSTLAAGCITGNISVERTAEVIMQSLPVCSVRKISYATFTIVNIHADGTVQVIEFDNPPALLLRDEKPCPLERRKILITQQGTEKKLYYSTFKIQINDRLIFCSDGVPQSGIGVSGMPFGWEWNPACEWIAERAAKQPGISARKFSQDIVNRSLSNDLQKARDDITCAVIYARKPRKMLLVTGPPILKERDAEMADRAINFDGNVVISGGTTANIICRESGKEAEVDFDTFAEDVPPIAKMPGVSLVTEGIITLSKAQELLSVRKHSFSGKKNGAVMITELLLESDEIEFLVGTKINEVHQDPNVPVGLEIRRSIVNQLAEKLRKKHLKSVTVSYI